MAYFANKRKAREYQSKTIPSIPGRIKYGSNPFLYARQVKEFKVKYDDKKNIEIIRWRELALYGNDETHNYRIKEIEPEKKRTIIRRPLKLCYKSLVLNS